MVAPTDRPLDGRVALVTGAGTGLGQGCPVALAARGATVLCVGRSVGPLEETVELIRAAGGDAQGPSR